MTFDVLFADQKTVRVEARSSGAARALAQDRRLQGERLPPCNYNLHAPQLAYARIIQVKQVKALKLEEVT